MPSSLLWHFIAYFIVYKRKVILLGVLIQECPLGLVFAPVDPQAGHRGVCTLLRKKDVLIVFCSSTN